MWVIQGNLYFQYSTLLYLCYIENMKRYVQFLKKITHSTFSSKEAKECGIDAYGLKLLARVGKIQKIERGIYRKADTQESVNDEMISALTHLGDPCCICLLSALYFYGITDEIPNQVWVYVPYGKYSHLKTIKVIRKRNPQWSIGIHKQDELRITSVERTLIDCLCDKKHFTEVDSIKFVKMALEDKLTTIQSLFKMAKTLGVDHRVKLILTLLQESYV